MTNPHFGGGLFWIDGLRGRGLGFFCGVSHPVGSGEGGAAPVGEELGNFLDVLRGGGEQTLPSHAQEAPEPRVTVAKELLGVGERALHRLLAPLLDELAFDRQPMRVDPFARVLPDMAGVMVRSALALPVEDDSSGQARHSLGSDL